MAGPVSELAGKSGVSPDIAKKGMGAVPSFLKDKLPAETFAKVSNPGKAKKDPQAGGVSWPGGA